MANQEEILVPRPDPTLLTTQQSLLLRDEMLREIKNSREAVELQLSGLHDVISTRLSEMDKAIILLQKYNDKAPECVKDNVSHLRVEHSEKFKGVDQQFTGLKTQTDKIAELNQKAIDAALLAAKELVGVQNKSNTESILKSENATTKQIDGIGDLIRSTAKSVDDKFSDLKDRNNSLESRLTALESRGLETRAVRTDSQASTGIWIAIAVAGISLLGLTVAVVTLIVQMKA